MRNGKAATSAAPKRVAHEVVAAVEQRLEPVQPPAQLLGPGGDPRLVGRRAGELGLDRVRRALPDAVEPVDEDVDLGAPRGVGGPERRVGAAASSQRDDPHRVGDDLVLVGLQDGHEVLAGELADGERSAGSTSTHSTATPLWASARATRSTFVENGIRRTRMEARHSADPPASGPG